MLISLLIHNPLAFLLLIIPLMYSIILHEVAHGLVALWFGDNTAKYSGRLTLNPISHIDPIGALMLFFVGFGWAKPVPVDYSNLRNGRWGLISVALAGCLANILIAAAAIFILQFQAVNSNTVFSGILLITARINIILAAFNLIPIPPLDGSRVLAEFLPLNAKYKLARIEPYGLLIVIVLLFTRLLYPVIDFIQGLIYGFIYLLMKLL